MAQHYLCYKCLNDKDVPGRPFIADAPKCPECGIDTAADKRVAHLIVQCKVIHFEPPHPVAGDAGVGSGELACGAKVAGARVTRAINAANCVKCLASDAGKSAERAQAATGDEFELDGVVDLKAQVIRVEK